MRNNPMNTAVFLITLLVFTLSENQSKNLQKSNISRRKTCHWQILSQKQQSSILNNLNGYSGQCTLRFLDTNKFDGFTEKTINAIAIKLYDPKYVDINLLIITINLTNSNQNNKEVWKKQNGRANYSKRESYQKFQFQLSYVIDNQTVSLSLDDNLIQIKYQDGQQPITMPIALIFFNLVLLILSEVVKRNNIIHQKISLLTLYHSITFMLFLSLIELIFGINYLPGSYSLFAVSGIMMITLGIRLIQIFQDCIRCIVGFKGYLTFYVVLFCYLWLLLNYGNSNVFLIINSLGFVPQIIHNIQHVSKLGHQKAYVFILMSNQFYILYLKGCPQNIMRYSPNFLVFKIVLFLTYLQVLIIICQDIYGPLFFVPRFCIPGYHNYFEEVIEGFQSEKIGNQQCPICLKPLMFSSTSQIMLTDSTRKNDSILDVKYLKKTIMKTPCKHRFHSKCLSEWMQYKRECPIDRRKLPPIIT